MSLILTSLEKEVSEAHVLMLDPCYHQGKPSALVGWVSPNQSPTLPCLFFSSVAYRKSKILLFHSFIILSSALLLSPPPPTLC